MGIYGATTNNSKSKKIPQSPITKSSKTSLPSSKKAIVSTSQKSSAQDIRDLVWFATLSDHWDSMELQNKDETLREAAMLKGLKLDLHMERNEVVTNIK